MRTFFKRPDVYLTSPRAVPCTPALGISQVPVVVQPAESTFARMANVLRLERELLAACVVFDTVETPLRPVPRFRPMEIETGDGAVELDEAELRSWELMPTVDVRSDRTLEDVLDMTLATTVPESDVFTSTDRRSVTADERTPILATPGAPDGTG